MAELIPPGSPWHLDEQGLFEWLNSIDTRKNVSKGFTSQIVKKDKITEAEEVTYRGFTGHMLLMLVSLLCCSLAFSLVPPTDPRAKE